MRLRPRTATTLLLIGSMVGTLVSSPPPAVHAASGDLTKVSLLGDSTMAGMQWNLYDNGDADTAANNDIREIVGNSYDMTFSAESCRRLVLASCVGRFGSRPVSLLPYIQTTLNGQLGQAMVVMAGYDDPSIANAVDLVMAEAERQGVVKVLWLTYRTGTEYVLPGGTKAKDLYQSHNAALAAAATRHAGLQILDWNTYSSGRAGWFASDGIHLTPTGAVGLAQYLKANLDAQQPVIGRCRNSVALSGAPDNGPTANPSPPGPLSGFTPMAPTRVLDTRQPGGGANGKLGAGRTVSIDLDGVVPDDATDAVLNITAVDSCLRGYLTVFPCGSRPPTSNVNYELGRITAGMAITAMTNHTACVYAFTTTDVVVDVIGSFGPDGDAFHPINPTRFVDTRGGTAVLTNVVGDKPASSDTTVQIRGIAGIPASATAVWANITVAEPPIPTVLSAYPGPCGSPPLASTVNARALHNTASSALVGVESDGTICVRTYAGRSNVVVDIAGWFGPGPGGLMYQSLPANRLLDTRTTSPPPSTSERNVLVSGPAVLNVIGVDATGPGFVTVHPCGDSAVSSLINMTNGENTANITAVSPGTFGAVCVRPSTAAQIVVDQIGSFVPKP